MRLGMCGEYLLNGPHVCQVKNHYGLPGLCACPGTSGWTEAFLFEPEGQELIYLSEEDSMRPGKQQVLKDHLVEKKMSR